jgi:hypothetical protein
LNKQCSRQMYKTRNTIYFCCDLFLCYRLGLNPDPELVPSTTWRPFENLRSEVTLPFVS